VIKAAVYIVLFARAPIILDAVAAAAPDQGEILDNLRANLVIIF